MTKQIGKGSHLNVNIVLGKEILIMIYLFKNIKGNSFSRLIITILIVELVMIIIETYLELFYMPDIAREGFSMLVLLWLVLYVVIRLLIDFIYSDKHLKEIVLRRNNPILIILLVIISVIGLVFCFMVNPFSFLA